MATKKAPHRPKKPAHLKALRVAVFILPRALEALDAIAAQDAEERAEDPSRGSTIGRLALEELARRARAKARK